MERDAGSAPPSTILARSSRIGLVGMEGRVLFPTLQQGPWLPLERFAESRTTGEPKADPHSHERQEIVNYLLEGEATYFDDSGSEREITAGTVILLSSFDSSRHDLVAKNGVLSRYVATVVELPHPIPPGSPPLQILRAVPRRPHSDRLRWLSLVGSGAPAVSSVGLEMSHLAFLKPDRVDLRVPPGVRVVAYGLEGSPKVEGHPLAPGDGILAEGASSVRVDGIEGDQAVIVQVPRRPG